MTLPFSIRCAGCSTKIKVAKQSLIGKTLPCPKCKTPIHVLPPAGVDAPPATELAPAPANELPADEYDDYGDDGYGDDGYVDDEYGDEVPYEGQLPVGATGHVETAVSSRDSPGERKWLLPALIGLGVVVLLGGGGVAAMMMMMGNDDADASGTLPNGTAATSTPDPADPADTTPGTTGQLPAPDRGTDTTSTPLAAGNASQARGGDAATADNPTMTTAARVTTPTDATEVEREAREAVESMITLLEQGRFEDFMLYHAPLRECDRFLEAVREGSRRPDPAPNEIQPLIAFLNTMKNSNITVHPSGRFAIFSEAPGAVAATPEVSPGALPAAAPPAYVTGFAASSVGYGNDLQAAIKSARADLQAGKADAFAIAMFPPTTIAMMKVEGRWELTLEQLAADKPQRIAMDRDLAILETLTPQINGDTAIYTLERTVTQPGRREGETYQDGTRTIRFSLIDGSWRFFDNTSAISQEIGAAFSREMQPVSAQVPGRETSESSDPELVKAGSDWRLFKFPRGL